MIESISEWVRRLQLVGVTELACAITLDDQTELPMLRFSVIGEHPLEVPPRVFACEGDQLLPMDGVQTFSEAIMRSGMTTEQKLHWLLIAIQECEQKVLAAAQEEAPHAAP